MLIAGACGDGEDTVSVRPDRPAAGTRDAPGDPLPACPGSRPDSTGAAAFLCDGSPEEILSWYRQLLVERSFALQGETRRDGRQVLAMAVASDAPAAAPTRRLTVTAEPAGNGSRVQIFEWQPEWEP